MAVRVLPFAAAILLVACGDPPPDHGIANPSPAVIGAMLEIPPAQRLAEMAPRQTPPPQAASYTVVEALDTDPRGLRLVVLTTPDGAQELRLYVFEWRSRECITAGFAASPILCSAKTLLED